MKPSVNRVLGGWHTGSVASVDQARGGIVEEHASVERRADVRQLPSVRVRKATLRPGCAVVLVDICAGGALVETRRPLRPGARVHFQVFTDERTFVLTAHVLRCSVWSLESNGITYRGGLKFEPRSELCVQAASAATPVDGSMRSSVPT